MPVIQQQKYIIPKKDKESKSANQETERFSLFDIVESFNLFVGSQMTSSLSSQAFEHKEPKLPREEMRSPQILAPKPNISSTTPVQQTVS